jgi:hypothetical protein
MLEKQEDKEINKFEGEEKGALNEKIDFTKISDSLRNIAKTISEGLVPIIEYMQELSPIIYKVIYDINENMPQRFKDINTKLANNGWYIIRDMDLNHMCDIEERSGEDLDEFMASFARKIITEIPTRIKKHYPKRWKIINDTVNAHESQLYTLSIPVILAQVDGIANEMFNISIFGTVYKTENPKTKQARLKVINEDRKSSEAIFLYPLDILTSFNNYHTKNDARVLNRNNVMHGSDISYDTEINSLRCFVLLNYVLDITEIYFEKENKDVLL